MTPARFNRLAARHGLRGKSQTAAALVLMGGMTPLSAAKKTGLKKDTVTRAVAKLQASPSAFYEAAKPERTRKFRRDTQSPNQLVLRSASALRAQVRHLAENHDVARGVLRTMVNNVVGPNGIGVEPQPRKRDGAIHEDYARALREAWRNWCRKPEVTHRHSWAQAQRMLARAWLRDGESFAQMLLGAVPYLDHGTRVPFSLEMFESDMVPMDYQEGERIAQGIERNAWGRPVAYFTYKTHPLESIALARRENLKRIDAARMLHVAALDRIGQLRGVSEFASVITRLEDVKDYEESERVAAKIAAKLTAYTKRGTPDMYNADAAERDERGQIKPREISLSAGMVIDTLAVGEEIGMIDSKRPNQGALAWRQGQLRAVAGGVGVSYSSAAKDYNGTYSAQRQELVEQWVNYAVLTDDFAGMAVRPVWENFVLIAHLSGVVRMPDDVDPLTADDALYIGQSMPWIDPLREADGWTQLVRSGFASEIEVMRKRGVNPRDVLEQITAFRKDAAAREMVFDSDAKYTSSAGTAQNYLRRREGTRETDDTPPPDAAA